MREGRDNRYNFNTVKIFIAVEVLVEQVLAGHQMAYHDWAHRIHPLQQFRAKSLRGFYVALAADAVDPFRRELVAELDAIRA